MYNCTHSDSYKIIKEHNYPTEFYIYKWHQFLQSQIGPASIQSRSFVELSPCWASVVVAVSVLALVVQAPEGFRSEDSPKDWSAGSSSPPCPWRNALPVVPSEFKIFIFHGIIASLHHCIMSRLSAPWAVYWPLYHGWNQDEIKALTGSISSASTGNWHMQIIELTAGGWYLDSSHKLPQTSESPKALSSFQSRKASMDSNFEVETSSSILNINRLSLCTRQARHVNSTTACWSSRLETVQNQTKLRLWRVSVEILLPPVSRYRRVPLAHRDHKA